MRLKSGDNDRDRTSVGKKLSDELGLPKALVNGLNHIEMNGNREAVVDGCKGILEYCEERIKLNLGNATILFTGSELCIKEYGCEQVKINGIIAIVEFG